MWWFVADVGEDPLTHNEPLLASLAQASIAGTLVFGANAGKRAVRFFGVAARDKTDHEDGQRNGYGFNLHAGSRAATKDKTRREMMCRYLLRPPQSNERLSRMPDGRYQVRLKSPWSDGTCAVVLDGPELVGRLVVLIPPPRSHAVRYFGVLAPRSALRKHVVQPSATGDGCGNCETATDPPTMAQRLLAAGNPHTAGDGLGLNS